MYDFDETQVFTEAQIELLYSRMNIPRPELCWFNYERDPVLTEKIDNWRKSLAPKDHTKYKTKRDEKINMNEVNKHDTKLKAKEDWFKKYIKTD